MKFPVSTLFVSIVSLLLVSLFLLYSHRLIKELSEEEHSKIEVWAESMRILSSESNEGEIPLILKVIQSNHTIPVMLLDANDNVLTYKNIIIPSKDSLKILAKKVDKLKASGNKIMIPINASTTQYLYYDDSTLLRKLTYYPYIQLFVMIVFLFVVFFSISSAKRAEQNKLWVGLSKETAHQLGTPISSLMAWIELLKMKNVDEKLLVDMNKDVIRLKTIAERFSKIGSKPEIIEVDIVPTIQQAVGYMSKRTSSKVVVETILPKEAVIVNLCVPLFEWVIENLCKNAIDAMDGIGNITLKLEAIEERLVVIEIADTGKGIPKSKFNTIFEAGYTTKSRGWGLGLTLVKRIVEEYHEGRIFVKSSEINKGTTFRIELKMVK